MRSFFLGVEGGGTRTRVLLADAQGFILAREYGGSASTLYVDPTVYRAELERILLSVRVVAEQAGEGVRIAGLGGPMDRAIVEGALHNIFGTITVRHYCEGDIALACHHLTWGVSLVAGTGASCRAINEKGEAHACGGYGPQFGDEGSGYWIGREAVSAAMRSRDGRGPATILSALICEQLELDAIWDILSRTERSGHISGPLIASLTPLVYRAAHEGDAAALDICNRAGIHLAGLANATVASLTFASQEVPLVLSGGVFAGDDLILSPFKSALSSDLRVRFSLYPPLTEVSEGLIHCLQREGR